MRVRVCVCRWVGGVFLNLFVSLVHLVKPSRANRYLWAACERLLHIPEPDAEVIPGDVAGQKYYEVFG